MSYEKETRTLMFVVVVACACVGIFCGGLFLYSKTNVMPQIMAGQPTDATRKTERNTTITQQDNLIHAVSDATTEYYSQNADVQNVIKTTTDFTAEIKDNIVLINCKCHAINDDVSADSVFQNRVSFENTEFVQDSIKEYIDGCATDCITFGENHFGLN